MDGFALGFLEAALWASLDDDESHLDANYNWEDFYPATLDKIKAECAKFQSEQAHLITRENCLSAGYKYLEFAGQDFFFTREHHGCGFWDGGWAEPAAKLLTEAAHKFGEVNLYVGDDNKIYAGG